MGRTRFEPVTDESLARARRDSAFRHRLLAESLERLLRELHRLQQAPGTDPARARQIREGVDLAVRLSDLIRRTAFGDGGTSGAA